MTTIVYLAVLFGCALALPSPSIDWSKIKPNVAKREPISNITYSSSRIVGGIEATPHSVPYQVAIIIEGNSFCGGSLISTSFVLTAAHCTAQCTGLNCVSVSYVQLIFGAHNVAEEEPTQIVVTSRDITNHPRYDPRMLQSDVALIRTPEPIPLNNFIQIIPLAPPTTETFEGRHGVLTGWGRTSDEISTISQVLQRVDVEVISNVACNDVYSVLIHTNNICTSGNGGVGGCNGDSGGPLVVDGVLAGVASFVSATGCEAGLPTGFARVSSQREWIESIIL